MSYYLSLIGRKIGWLTVVKFSHRKGCDYFLECQCDCGSTKLVRASDLKREKTKSCGCLRQAIISGLIKQPVKLRNDLSGRRFERLTVQNFSHRQNTLYYYECLCDCGTAKVVSASDLQAGSVRSCGCLFLETSIEKLKQYSPSHKGGTVSHGMSKTRVWNIWMKMKARCNNPSNPDYRYYGGRGISICQEWEQFENFYADMGEPPEGFTIERVDNDKGYSKSNCRWATRQEQVLNTRRNQKFEYEGELLTVSQLARISGLSYHVLRYRLVEKGWDVKTAMETPVLKPHASKSVRNCS